MGLNKSKVTPLTILVIGVSRAGKTHFLDMFFFGSDSTKVPTHGFYETVVKHTNGREIRLVEYGGEMNWAAVLKGTQHRFDAIYLMIRSDASEEERMESNNALLMMSELLPHAVVAVVWNLREGGVVQPLKWMPRSTSSCVCHVDFAKVEWRERVLELFEWTIANSHSAQRQVA